MLFRVTAFLTLMLFRAIDCGGLVQTLYNRLESGEAYGSSFSVIQNVESLTECALHCQSVNGCSGVEFEPPPKQTCNLYRWPLLKYPSTSSRAIWIANDVKLLVVSKQDGAELTLSQAEGLCSSLGTRIVSHTDIYDAYDAGFNLCKCGWTQGGIIRLVLTQSDPTCANTNGASGVISCKWTSVAEHVFCIPN